MVNNVSLGIDVANELVILTALLAVPDLPEPEPRSDNRKNEETEKLQYISCTRNSKIFMNPGEEGGRGLKT